MTSGRLKLKKPEEQRSPGRFGDQLWADQRGATMVMGVFIAVLLVGMIYYVWGIGDAIMHRERMQDASDTAAFSAAVIHARGMNMLALINVIMTALVFILATLSTLASMLGWASALAGIVCLGCAPSLGSCTVCCEACVHAARHYTEYSQVDRWSDQADNALRPVMNGMKAYAAGIRYGVPIAAQAKVVSYGTDVYSPVTDLGVMAPLRLELPAQVDETTWPCDERDVVLGASLLTSVRIASGAGALIYGHFSPYLAGGIIAGEIEARGITNQFCEDGYFTRITDAASEMGNDEYQCQAYMIGDPDLEWTQEGVAVATWGEGDDAGSTYSSLAEMGRVSFAQAEFFYDDDEEDYREWLYHMNWRARLRRWRLSASGVGGITEACGGGAGCGARGSLGGAIDSVVVQ
jgi:hypothetical protein